MRLYVFTRFDDCPYWRSQCKHVVIALKDIIECELEGLKELLPPNSSFETEERINLLESTKLKSTNGPSTSSEQPTPLLDNEVMTILKKEENLHSTLTCDSLVRLGSQWLGKIEKLDS